LFLLYIIPWTHGGIASSIPAAFPSLSEQQFSCIETNSLDKTQQLHYVDLANNKYAIRVQEGPTQRTIVFRVDRDEKYLFESNPSRNKQTCKYITIPANFPLRAMFRSFLLSKMTLLEQKVKHKGELCQLWLSEDEDGNQRKILVETQTGFVVRIEEIRKKKTTLVVNMDCAEGLPPGPIFEPISRSKCILVDEDDFPSF